MAQINKLSNKESLIYYLNPDSTVNAIEYLPFLKVKLDRINQTYTISQIILSQFILEINFNLIDKNFYIKFNDKKHRKTIEILNLELINRE